MELGQHKAGLHRIIVPTQDSAKWGVSDARGA